MPFPRLSFSITEVREVLGGLRPHKVSASTKITIQHGKPDLTPAVLAISHNGHLPSSQIIPKSERTGYVVAASNPDKSPIKEVWDSSKRLFEQYKKEDWMHGLILLSFITLFQIFLTTLLEFGLRTLGAYIMYPANSLHEHINKQEASDLEKWLKKISVTIVFSPSLCFGHMLTWAADVSSYNREWVDSATHLFNPVEIGCKLIEGLSTFFLKEPIKTRTPSFSLVIKTFASSSLSLLPAAALVTLGLGPLNTFFSSASGIESAAVFTFGGGAFAVAAKIFSGSARKSFNYLTKKSKKTERGSYPGSTRLSVVTSQEPTQPRQSTKSSLESGRSSLVEFKSNLSSPRTPYPQTAAAFFPCKCSQLDTPKPSTLPNPSFNERIDESEMVPLQQSSRMLNGR